MDQGSSAFSTLTPVRQGAPPDRGGDDNLNDAVASLLSRPDPAAALGDDHDLLQLGVEFDVAHERWRDAVEAAREPTERHDAVLAVVRTRGHLTMADHKAAEALPGFREATRAEEDALNVVARLSERALRMPAHSIQGLAVQARCLIPCVWPEGVFEEKAALGRHEGVDYEMVRLMIASCCAAAGVDWKGTRVDEDQAAVSAACAFPGIPGGTPSCALFAMVAEWQRLLDTENSEDLNDEASELIYNARALLHDQICTFPVASIADLTAKLPVFRDELMNSKPSNPTRATLDHKAWCCVVRDLEAVSTKPDVEEDIGARPANSVASSNDQHSVRQAVGRHRQTKEALEAAARADDVVGIRARGGDVSQACLRRLNASVIAASIGHDQAYRDLIATRPKHLADLLMLLRHLSECAEDHNGMENEPDVYGALIGAVEGMRIAGVVPAAGHDLSRLSIAELENLARIAHQEQETLMAVEQTSPCYDRAKSNITHLGNLVELETQRFSLLGDHAVYEIARRRPANKHETDLRLETMARHHLRCNGYIDPDLLSEIVTAWGGR